MKKASIVAALILAGAAAPWSWAASEREESALDELKAAQGDDAAVEGPRAAGRKAVSPGEDSGGKGPIFEAAAEMTWRSYGEKRGELETLGTERTAEQGALAKCEAAGFQGCVVSGTVLQSCASRRDGEYEFEHTCSAKATAIPGGVEKGSRSVLIRRGVYWTIDYGWGIPSSFGPLRQLGVERAAEERALDACREQGHSACVVVKAKNTKCNHFWSDNKVTCKGIAMARGSSD